MAIEPSNINLDDIFSALPGLESNVSATYVNDKPRTESIRSQQSAASKALSHHTSASSHHTTIISEHHIPPEPKSRASSHISQATSVSTLKPASVPVSHVVSHAAVHQQPVAAPREPSIHHGHDDGLMDSIFGVVQLPDVQYGTSNASSVHTSHQSHHHHHDDHSHAIQHIDDVLAGELTDGHDGMSIASDHSYRAPSHHSHRSQHSVAHSQVSKKSNGVNNYSELWIPQEIERTRKMMQLQSAPQKVAESVVRNSFDELQLNAAAHNNNNGYHYSEYPEEEHDSFEPAHLPYAFKENAHRPRTMTIDSMASVAETRYGGFDVHDDYGHPMAQEIDLHHNEVAYQRPKKSPVPKSQPVAAAPVSLHTGGTYKLQQLNREVAEARQKQATLTAQVERMEVEVERKRQQNLAREAAHKVGQVNRGAPIRSASVTSQSSVPSHVSSSHHNHQGSNYGSSHSHTSHTNHTSHTASHTTQSASQPGYTRSLSSGSTIVSHLGDVRQTSIYEEEPVAVSEVAQHQLNHGHSIGQVGKYNLVVPLTEEVQGFSENQKIKKVVIGGQSLPTEDDKCVLLFGPVGSGKTSALNSMLNYLYDVKKENDFRFVLSSEHSKTNALTAYVINNSILPFSVTVVDTPGVIDEKGNKTVSTLIKTWFQQELLDAGAFRLDAISIVLRHDEDNLGWPFIYELATVKRMFGDDLKTNVLPIITHTEVLPQPLAIRSLAQANISFVEYYKVNNIGFEPEAKGITKLQHNLYFTHGLASLELFFRDLQELIHPLLAVLRSGAGARTHVTHSYEGTTLY